MRFAITAPDGTIENIVVAARAEDVALPEGRAVFVADDAAEIGGWRRPGGFEPAPRPQAPPRRPDPVRAIRALALRLGLTPAEVDALIDASRQEPGNG